MNEDRITVTGVVGSDPRPFLSGKGLPITTFRLASSPRVFDRERGEWRDGETNWYTVSAFRRLADNVAFSLRKGEHVVVTGKLRLRAWQTAEKSGTSAEIDADAVGHDLSWAVTRAQRLQPRETTDASPAAAGEGAAPVDGPQHLESGEPGGGAGSTSIEQLEQLGFGVDENAPRGYLELDGEALAFVDELDDADDADDADPDDGDETVAAADGGDEHGGTGDGQAGAPERSGMFSFGRR